MVETGFWCWVPGAGCRVPVLVVPGAGAGAGAVSWLCTWWKQVAGAGCRVPLVETGCWCWVPGAGAGAGAVSWLCTWWRQVLVLVLGAGCRCWRWRQGAGAVCRVRAVSWLRTWWRRGAGAGRRCWCGCCELAVYTQHHTVSSLERSLSISAVWYLPSSGSVLADSCVKGCTVCAHTQRVSACYTQ